MTIRKMLTNPLAVAGLSLATLVSAQADKPAAKPAPETAQMGPFEVAPHWSRYDFPKSIKEGQAYASDVIPKAQGTSARLREEAEGYKSSVIAQAEGDAQRFSRVLTEYQKAPGVTRDRLYVDTMREVDDELARQAEEASPETQDNTEGAPR